MGLKFENQLDFMHSRLDAFQNIIDGIEFENKHKYSIEVSCFQYRCFTLKATRVLDDSLGRGPLKVYNFEYVHLMESNEGF